MRLGGYLIHEDQIAKTLAPHLAYVDDEGGCQGNGIITIPNARITSLELVSLSAASAASSAAASENKPS